MRAPDVEVVYRAVDARLDKAAGAGPIHQAAPGRALIDLPSVARVLVEDGRRATVQRAPGASDEDVGWMLAGPVRVAAELQRGAMALRASAVVVGAAAVALVGGPARGKSAVAAALAIRGHRVLADSTLPVDVDVDGGATARGTSSRLELWPNAAISLDLDPDDGDVVRPGLAKRAHRFPAAANAPLAAVVVLNRTTDQGEPEATRLRGRESIRVLSHRTAMAPLVAPLGLRHAHWLWLTRLASSVPVFGVDSDRERRDLPAVADAVEALVA